MDKLSCMRAFVNVVEAEGFTEAARRMGVSKALVSKQVGQLEESLGVRLLHRTTRRVTTSSTGRAYFEQCKPLLAEIEELDTSVQLDNAMPTGELRITAPILFAELHLVDVMAEYTRRYPEVSIEAKLTDSFVDLVGERIDMAIRIGQLQDSSLVAKRLGDTALVLCASPHYLEERPAPRVPDDLAGHDCIVDTNSPDAPRWRFKGPGGALTVTPTSRIQVNGARVTRDLLLSGLGIAQVPSFAVAGDIAAGRLRVLMAEFAPDDMGIYAMYPHRKHLSAKVRTFIELSLEHCRSLACRPPSN